MGERMTALAMSVCVASRVAWAWATAAVALASSALARSNAAWAASNSVCEGTLPSLNSRTR